MTLPTRTLARAAEAAADAERWADDAPWLARLREADARVLLRIAEGEWEASGRTPLAQLRVAA